MGEPVHRHGPAAKRRPGQTGPNGLPVSSSIPYPAIERHGVIGDRRTAALVSSDGTIDWLCLPDYDGAAVFGALLDASKGGRWKLGPAVMSSGQQSYWPGTMVLRTEWRSREAVLVLSDAMAWPETDRSPGTAGSRVVVRRLACKQGRAWCAMELHPSWNFSGDSTQVTRNCSGYRLRSKELDLELWLSPELMAKNGRWATRFELRAGETVWAVLQAGSGHPVRSLAAARKLLLRTCRFWRRWVRQLRYQGRSAAAVRRSAQVLHLLTYAPAGSLVAAPTASVPEQVGGQWNADYRLCWVRDASLSLASLQQVGGWKDTQKYLDWLTERQCAHGPPLQVVYGIHGETEPKQRTVPGVFGYRGSKPVRFGNHAYKQFQLDAFGFLADCIWSYLRTGGRWRQEYWRLVQRAAAFVCAHWHRPGNGIWELARRQHYVSGKVMAWVMLDRAIKIGQVVAPSFDTAPWAQTRRAIHREVMEKGWSDRLQAFRQRYEAENLDAAALLIPVFEFLPAHHPRVTATVDRIAEHLTIDGFVYRFRPSEVAGLAPTALGELEGAFLPCTFWLATAYAKAGRKSEARQILRNVEKIAGGLGLFAEAVDPRTSSFLGNTPLLFSHVEYLRTLFELEGPAEAKS